MAGGEPGYIQDRTLQFVAKMIDQRLRRSPQRRRVTPFGTWESLIGKRSASKFAGGGQKHRVGCGGHGGDGFGLGWMSHLGLANAD